jgi:hypothetical protein
MTTFLLCVGANSVALETRALNGAPGETRTPDPLVRRAPVRGKFWQNQFINSNSPLMPCSLLLQGNSPILCPNQGYADAKSVQEKKGSTRGLTRI